MKQRPILVAMIGYIIGIIEGVYLKSSILLFYISFFIIYLIIKQIIKKHRKPKFKLLSFYRYKRYFKLIFSKKVILILIISSIISNTVVLLENKKYDLYKNNEKIFFHGIIISEKIEKPYYNRYKVKTLGNHNFQFYIHVKKTKDNLNYGDEVKVEGIYLQPSEQRNHGGYNDKQYLKTLKICGRIKVSKIEVVQKHKVNKISLFFHQTRKIIEQKIDTTFAKEKSEILKGILLGKTDEMEEEVKEQFQTANISHVLAISGMHISYLILGIQLAIEKLKGKRKTRIITIVALLFYIGIIGFSPSVIRAVIMAILVLVSKLIYQKADTINSLAISLLIILLYNPFLIFNIGLQLSYLGTIGIVLIQPLLMVTDKTNKIKEIIKVTLSAQIMILPVMIYHFNQIGIYFIFSNLLISIIIGPIIILGFLYIFCSLCFPFLGQVLSVFLEIGLMLLNCVAQISKLPFAKIYLPTPNNISILFYYLGIGIFFSFFKIYTSSYINMTQKRIKNLVSLFYYKLYPKRKKIIIYILIIILLFCVLYNRPKDLRIHFVDVGQGDCTFIVTPQNKTILIDGGGNDTIDFDIGKKSIIPYILDKGYRKLDYVFISHFDTDHVRSDC